MRFFPSDAGALEEIGGIFEELCKTDDEARMLTDAVLRSCDEWPGPAKLREVFASEVASKRARGVELDGCENCREAHGFRRMFRVIERMPDGSERTQEYFPDGGVQGAITMERELRARCAGTTSRVVDLVAPCSCALGRRRRESLPTSHGNAR